jgi:hypothetical protein
VSALFFGAQAIPKVCAEIEDLLSGPMRSSVDKNPEKYCVETWDFLLAVEKASQAVRDRRSLATTRESHLSPLKMEEVKTFSVSQTAEHLGCTRQAVLDRIARRTLRPLSERGERNEYRIPVDQLPEVS